MPSHWTYEAVGDVDLFQGDILDRSSELIGMLRGVFPYFCDERYIGFLVTTQTCDLVRRGGDCKSKYITLAVIRELGPLLPELLDEVCGTECHGVYKKEARFHAEQVLIRLVNQNEQSRGLFYLHPDADAGVATSSVGMLRVTFSLQRQHYDLLAAARIGRLRAEFANKLGWLSGNLFSRVATPDWSENNGNETASSLAKKFLRSVSEENDENWVSDDWIREAVKKKFDLSSIMPSKATSALQEFAPDEPIEVIISRADVLAREVLAERDIKQGLRGSAEFLRSISASICRETVGDESTNYSELTSALAADDKFCDAVCNYVSSKAKKRFKQLTSDPERDLCEFLANLTGAIPPITNRVRALASTLPKPMSDDELSFFAPKIRDAKLFSSDVLVHVDAVVSAIISEHAERHKELAKRLKDDPRVKAALRR